MMIAFVTIVQKGILIPDQDSIKALQLQRLLDQDIIKDLHVTSAPNDIGPLIPDRESIWTRRLREYDITKDMQKALEWQVKMAEEELKRAEERRKRGSARIGLIEICGCAWLSCLILSPLVLFRFKVEAKEDYQER
ncbi:MAG: hypothetical protein GXO39_09330 [Thermotogae bacterium]|nr:hypothetical protein [Thermotogota bacterium]